MLKPLPNWTVLQSKYAFDDTESNTAIEQTARIYKTMQDLIKDYNEFINQINTEIDSFTSSTNAEQEVFETHITTIMHEYIHSMDTKIDNAIVYMKTNIEETTGEVVNQLIEDGQISVALTYDDSTESLDIITSGGVE